MVAVTVPLFAPITLFCTVVALPTGLRAPISEHKELGGIALNVMIVEDELLVALELERIIDSSGHTIIAIVATVDQALAYAPKVDIAFVDIRLAGGDNGALLARRLIDRFHTKVIFVTANPSEVGNGLDGAVDLISKPFTDERILAGLAKAVALLPEVAKA